VIFYRKEGGEYYPIFSKKTSLTVATHSIQIWGIVYVFFITFRAKKIYMPNLAFALITSLFFLWGLALNLNSILIPQLKKACQLSDFQSAWIDSAFFLGYFVMAIPAGKVIQRYGYRKGILAGLLLFALGAFLFVPAANMRTYSMFLGALFVIASGLTFLETAANPYVTVLGPPETATERINFAQSFNGLAASLAPLLGGLFIFSGRELSPAQSNAMTAAELAQYLDGEVASVKLPYMAIGVVVLAVAWLFYKIQLPEPSSNQKQDSLSTNVWLYAQVRWGVLAQLLYVGAQVCVSSFFIRYMKSSAHFPEKQAAYFMSVALLLFMIGRFVGTVLLRYVAAARLLAIYALACMALLAFVVWQGGMLAAYALLGVEFFMSIMFPTIFSLSLRGLGTEATKTTSSYLVMAIVGGALLPLLMGRLSDARNIQTAYLVPLLCFVFIAWYGWRQVGVKSANA
jgi:MFS transporter, FHS family, L-fucose permease